MLNSNFTKPTSSYPGYVIKAGKRGDVVKKIQERLIELGYSCGRYGADGIFGRRNREAESKNFRETTH